MDQARDTTLTLFVACYNEEANVAGTLDTLVEALREVSAEAEVEAEIIVIDDASTDGTAQCVRQYMQRHPELAILLKVNRFNKGLAQNYIDAAFLGRGTYYRLICGDNVEPKQTFVTLFRRLGEADMLIPYQVECPGRSLFRRILSRTYTRLVNLLSGHHIRYYNGLAVHLRHNVMRWHTNYHGFAFQADLVTRLLDEGISYVEVPVRAHERANGRSKALTLKNWLSVSHFFLDLVIRRLGKLLFHRELRAAGEPGIWTSEAWRRFRQPVALSSDRRAA
jgi:glycosyltransferase involved in cell wall biosynthesis